MSKLENSRQSQLDDDAPPTEAPPPYTEVANPATEQTTDGNFNAPYVAQGQANRPPPQPPRPQQQQPQRQQNQQQQMNYLPTPKPVPSSPGHTLQGGNTSYPGTNANSYTYGGNRPSAPPQRQQQQQQHQQYGSRAAPNVPWTYPAGYFCPKCNNTGIKLKNGLQCQDCWGAFARQRAQVVPTYGNSGSSGFGGFGLGGLFSRQGYSGGRVGNGGVVVRPGDPRIGGVQCGRCRGSGQIGDFFGSYNCPTCGGIGRIL